MIVTQPVTLDYLTEKFPFALRNVVYVYGGVLPTSAVSEVRKPSEQLQIVFVANKYHPEGLDKGFDLFLGAMNTLTKAGMNFVAHIIGPWALEDISQEFRSTNFVLHGVVASSRLQKFLSEFDLAIFPTRSNELGNGTFDGFPTGSAVEAGLSGCVVLTTNPLGQECPLTPGKDYIAIEASLDSIIQSVLSLNSDRESLNKLKKQSAYAFSQIFSLKNQMEPRLGVIKSLIEQSTCEQ